MQMTIVSAIAAAIAIFVIVTMILRKKMGGRAVPDELRPGQQLPSFIASDESGTQLKSDDLRGRPTVILFVRGTWCPFCSKQVANLTKRYKDINDLGARLIFVTPKPLETTRRVAEFFEVEFEFWLDESLEIAKSLGLVLSKGVPADFQTEYGEDTVWPTSLVVDGSGIIRYTSLSKFVVDRPDPNKLLNAVRSIQESAQ
jgi:peroxiredoxin